MTDLDATWARWHFFYRPLAAPTSEGALSLEGRTIRTRLRPTVSAEQIKGGADLDTLIPVIRFEDATPVDAVRILARQAGLGLVVDKSVAASAGGPLSLRLENVTARQALGAVLEDHHLVLLAGDAGKLFRLLPKDSPWLQQVGSEHWLFADCRFPRTGDEVRQIGLKTGEVLQLAKARDGGPVPKAGAPAIRFADLPLGKVMAALAREAKVNFIIPAPSEWQVESLQADASPEDVFTDLIDVFGLGLARRSPMNVLEVHPTPFVAAEEARALWSAQARSLERVAAASRSLTALVRPDGSPTFAGDGFMGPQRLAPRVLSSMILSLRLSAFLSGVEKDRRLEIESIAGAARHALRIPTLEGWAPLASALDALGEIALAQPPSPGSPTGDASLPWLTQVDTRRDLAMRLVAEQARLLTVLREFPRALVVPALAQLDRDPEVRVSPTERVRLGWCSLAAVLGPAGWLQQNEAAALDFYARLARQAGLEVNVGWPVQEGRLDPRLGQLLSLNTPVSPTPWHPHRFLAELGLRHLTAPSWPPFPPDSWPRLLDRLKENEGSPR